MNRSGEKFARLLTEGVYRISLHKSKTIQSVQDELGYALGKKGGASIEYWRKGHLPAKLSDVEQLAREIVKRARLEQSWLEEFLQSANHPAPAKLCEELFPPLVSAKMQEEPSTLPDSPVLPFPLDTVPDPAPLPPGSQMPLGRNPLFVGRQHDLRALAAILKIDRVTAVSQVKTAAITGIGGIGKTQLASELVHRYGQFFTGGVFWLSFDDAEAVPAKIAACGGPGALDLSPGFANLPLDDQVRLVRDAWQRPWPRLLVFDNCEEPELLVNWRPSSGGCRVLVTSRRGEWEPVLGVETLALGVLSRHESLTLLSKYCPAADTATLDAIAEKLGDLPLALYLAGRYLYRYQRVVSPADYLARLQDAGLLHHPSLQRGGVSPTGHIQHVGQTFALSYERLDPDDEIDALSLALLVRIAHFAPGESIWHQLLIRSLDQYPGDPHLAIKAERGLFRLIELGLIEIEEDNTLRMHRLVAAFVRDGAKDELEATQEIVEKVVLEEIARVNREAYPLLLLAWQPHLRSVTDVAQARGDERGARLCNEMGEHLRQIGDYDGARLYFEKALAIWRKIAGEDHPDTAESFNNLGRLLRDQGDLLQARPLLEKALAVRKKVLGKEHPKTAESYNEVGRWLYLEEDLDAARRHFEQALAISHKVWGNEHRLTADYLNNLGMCLDALGDLLGAQQCLKQALTIRQKVWGEEHPRTALSLNNMGYLLRGMGQLTEAQQYFEQALAIRQKVFGEEHPDTAESLTNLGELLLAQGDLDRAQSYLQRTLAIYEKVLGEEHPDAAYALNNLGLLLQAQNDLDTAQWYLERALTIRQKTFGNNNSLTALSLYNLGRLLQTKGDLDGALSYLEQALATYEACYGSNHANTRAVRDVLIVLNI